MERKVITDQNGTEVYTCGPTSKYVKFFFLVWNYIDLCKFSLVPFFIRSLCNMRIIYKVVSNNRKMKTQVAPSGGTATEQWTKAMSKLLLTLNFVFIVTTAPVCVYLIGEPYWVPRDVPRDIQLEDPWWAVVNMLMYINNTVNFGLYCFSGTKFRRELVRLFTKKADRNSSHVVQNLTDRTNLNQRSAMNRATGI